jgi:hypothetical protein
MLPDTVRVIVEPTAGSSFHFHPTGGGAIEGSEPCVALPAEPPDDSALLPKHGSITTWLAGSWFWMVLSLFSVHVNVVVFAVEL